MTRARDLGDFIADGAAAELVVDTTTLVVDSTNNRVGIGTASPATALDVVGNATITVADNSDALTIVSTDADANAGPILKLRRNSASPADNDLIGAIDWTSENSDGDEHDFLNLTARMRDVTAGSEDVAYAWTAYLNGTGREIQSFVNTDASAASMVFNEDSQDIDFRVESNSNTHMLFVDAGNDRIGVGTSSPSRKLSVFDSSAPYLALQNSTSGSTTSDGLQFQLASANSYLWNYENGFMAFATNNAERFRFGSSGQLGIGGATYGTSGQVLTSGGSGAAPTWADAAEANFTASATASENLTANRYVALNSSGQFENMFSRLTGDTFYSPNYPSNNNNRRLYADYFGGDNFYFAALYDSTNGNHQVYVVQRATSGSGNTATKGAILSINTGSNQPAWNMGIYRSSNSSFYYFWGVDQSSTVNYHVFTRSGTTITQSGSGTFSTDNQMRCSYPGFKTPWVSYNANQDKIVFSYINASNYGYAKVLTPGSTSITANNSDQLIMGGAVTYHITHVENSAVGNCVVFVRIDYNSPYHTHVQAASISGTGSSASLTFGTSVDLSNDNGTQESPVPPRIFDISQDGNSNFTNAMLILSEKDQYNLNRFAISVSGTTITDGNVVNNLSLGNDGMNTWNAVHQKGMKRIYYGWVDNNNFYTQPLDTTSATFANVSGSSSVNLQGTISGSSAQSILAMGASPSASNPYILTSAVRYTGSYYVRHKIATMVENNSINWYGYLTSSVNSGQSATVILVGNVSNITCTLGSRLYLHTDGTVTSTSSSAYATVGLGTGTNTGTIYGKYVGVAGT